MAQHRGCGCYSGAAGGHARKAGYPAPQEQRRRRRESRRRRVYPHPFDGGMPMTKHATVGLALLLSAAWLLVPRTGVSDEQGKDKPPTKAICVMTPLSGSQVSGVVYFTQKGDEVEITGQIKGLTPGLHGFHVHEFGDMTSKDGMSTGGHFNPDGKMHGGIHSKERHVGDLGNVTADKDGVVTLNIKDKIIQLHGAH